MLASVVPLSPNPGPLFGDELVLTLDERELPGMPSPALPPQATLPAHLKQPSSVASGLGPDDLLRVARCVSQLHEAEALLVRARGSLAELGFADGLDHGRRPNTGGGGRRPSRSSRAAPKEDEDDTGSPGPPFRLPPPINFRGPANAHTHTGSPAPSLVRRGSERSIASERKTHPWCVSDLHMDPSMLDQIVVTSIDKRARNDRQYGKMEASEMTLFNVAHGGDGSGSPTAKAVEGVLSRQLRQKQVLGTILQEFSWQPIFGGWMKVPVLHPEAYIRLLWMILGFLFIVYEAFAIPVYMAFDVTPEGGLFIFACIVNSYFLTDICVQFLSGHMDAVGEVVFDPREVGLMYMRTWLVPDLIAGIPWEWIFDENSAVKVTRGVRVVKMVRLFRLMRLLRLAKLGPLMDRLETRLESNHLFLFLTGILRIVGLLVAVCHWSACIWYAIGSLGMDSGMQDSWLLYYKEHFPDISDDKSWRYIFAIYYCLTTMTTVGYGDFTPRNFLEVRFAISLLMVSSVLFASLMGTLTNMLLTLNRRRQELSEKKVELSRYMRWRNVPWKLMVPIRQHLIFMWEANQGYDAYEDDLKTQLSPLLKAELCSHIYGRILKNAPFLSWMNEFAICLQHLAEKVKSIFLEPGDHVFRMGQINDQIYMLIQGTVVITRIEHLGEQEQRELSRHEETASGLEIPRNSYDDYSNIMSPITAQLDGLNLNPVAHLARHGRRNGTQKFILWQTGLNTFDSDVLESATQELRVNDFRRRVAARKVQRIWRQRMKHRQKFLPDAVHVTAGIQIDRLPTREVGAPAYFGESCLWQPLEDWGRTSPPPYMYSTRCKTRGEFIYIPRDAIQDLLLRFSPWMPERFERFRKTVHGKLCTLMEEDMARTHSAG